MVTTEKAKLRTQAMFLVGGSYSGSTKELVFKKLHTALEDGIIHLEELGITKEQWSNLEKEFLETDTCLPAEKMTPNEARVLVKSFSALWQESKSKDGDAKMEIFKKMYSMWDLINIAIHNKLISNKDLGFESASEYFSVQHEMHEIKELMDLFGEKE